MLCDRCHTREATVHYTQIVNGRRTEEHLCPECAAQSRVMSGGMDSLMHSMFDHSFFQNIWSDPLSELRNLTCRSVRDYAGDVPEGRRTGMSGLL